MHTAVFRLRNTAVCIQTAVEGGRDVTSCGGGGVCGGGVWVAGGPAGRVTNRVRDRARSSSAASDRVDLRFEHDRRDAPVTGQREGQVLCERRGDGRAIVMSAAV